MDRVTFEKKGHVARIGLHRANKRNAFDVAMLEQLAQAYTEYEDDSELWCALLFAHGDHFTGGLDLAEVGPAIASGKALFPPGSVDPLALGPRRLSKPLVAALQGYCFTIGIELALAADVRLAAEGARFAQLEVKRGIFPFGGATMRFAAQCGYGNTMKWLLTGDTFDAAEALRMGLVQEVVPADQLFDRALWMTERIAAQAPIAVQATLQSVRNAHVHGLEAENALLLERARKLMATEDAAEGMRSFVERREGVFRGK